MGNKTGLDFQTIYGLMQCTPGLSEQDCSDCLEKIMTNIRIVVAGSMAGRLLPAVI